MPGHEIWRWLGTLAATVAIVTLFWGPLVAIVENRPPAEQRARGFHAGIYSEPGGARVIIQGRLRGTTPWIGNVSCRNEESISIQVQLQGFETWARTLPCREGKSLEINARFKTADDGP